MKHVVESGDFFFFCVLAWYKDRGDLQSYRGESKTPEDAEVPVSGVLWRRNIFSLLSRLFFKNNANSLFALVLDDDDEERMLAKHHNAGKNERRV